MPKYIICELCEIEIQLMKCEVLNGDDYEGDCPLDVMLCNLVRRYIKITVF